MRRPSLRASPARRASPSASPRASLLHGEPRREPRPPNCEPRQASWRGSPLGSVGDSYINSGAHRRRQNSYPPDFGMVQEVISVIFARNACDFCPVAFLYILCHSCAFDQKTYTFLLTHSKLAACSVILLHSTTFKKNAFKISLILMHSSTFNAFQIIAFEFHFDAMHLLQF